MNLDAIGLAWVQSHRTPVLDLMMREISSVTSSEMCCLWAGLIALLLVFKRQFTRASFLFFGTALGSLLVEILKLAFSRRRPPTSTLYDSYSFPSGHALSSTVFFGLVAWHLSRDYPYRRKSITAVAGALTLWVGLSRVILGFHWPSDVLGGFVFGFIFLRTWIWIMMKLTLRPAILR